MIDPQTNPQGEEFEAYNRRRWGGSGWTHHLKLEGKKDGAMFHNWTWWPNTNKVHQLIQYACKKYNVDSDVCNQVLFQALYEEGKNISLVEDLVKIGKEKLNLDKEKELERYLEKDEGMEDVYDEIESGSRRYNIRGVPYFVIQRSGYKDVELSGAQDSKSFVRVLQHLSQ